MATASAFLLAIAASASAKSVPPATLLALRGGGSMTLPQAVVSLTGSALTLGGVANLLEPEAPKQEGLLKKLQGVRPAPSPVRRRNRFSKVASGLVLFGWGLAKLCVSTIRNHDIHINFCRMNVLPMIAALAIQSKGGRGMILPLKAQSALAAMYACIAFGVTRINKPGNENSRFSDRFMEYMPEKRLYLV